MANTDLVININGSLVADPKMTPMKNGEAAWKFAMALNHKDNATTWVNIVWYASPENKIMTEAKKGTTLRVAAKLPWLLNEYTFGFNQEKNSGNISLQAFGVERGVFDSKKSEGDSEADKFDSKKKDDGLVPANNGFSIPEVARPPF